MKSPLSKLEESASDSAAVTTTAPLFETTESESLMRNVRPIEDHTPDQHRIHISKCHQLAKYFFKHRYCVICASYLLSEAVEESICSSGANQSR